MGLGRALGRRGGGEGGTEWKDSVVWAAAGAAGRGGCVARGWPRAWEGNARDGALEGSGHGLGGQVFAVSR